MMSFPAIITIFSLSGLLIPLLFRAIWHFLEYGSNPDTQLIVFQLMLLLWPTSLMAFASSQEPGVETTFFLFSMAANVIFYAVLGVLVWLGLRRHAAFFAIAGVGWGLLWWKLLSL